MEESTKTCTTCNTSYPNNLEHFHSRKTSLDGLNTICKICVKTKKRRNIQHWNQGKLFCLKCKTYKDIEEFSNVPKRYHRANKNGRCKTCIAAQAIKRKQTQRGHLTLRRMFVERWQGVRDRTKLHNHTLEFGYEFLQELWNTQQGLCAISGIPMTYIMGHGRVPTNVSVDRKDSSLGYTKKNTQLVCMAVNQMKSDLSMNELLTFCNKIVEKHEESSQNSPEKEEKGE